MEKREFEKLARQAVEKAISLLQYNKNIDLRLLAHSIVQDMNGSWRFKFSIGIEISQEIEYLSFPDIAMTDPEYPAHFPLIQPDTINKLKELKNRVPDLEGRAACIAAGMYALGIKGDGFVPKD